MSELNVNTITEYTTNNGVTIDGVLIKDGDIASSYISGLKIIQVVSGVTTTNSTNTTATLADTGLSATITPTSASNKILVIVSQHYLSYRANTTAGGRIALLRDATVIVGNTSYDIIQGYAATNENKGIHNIVYMDSPATTSSITYKTQHRVESATNSAVIEISRNSHPSSIVLMEVVV
jgi:hypothetical protein